MSFIENMNTVELFRALVDTERIKQNEKWGPQHHSLPEWITILAEEMGKFAKEAGEWHWRKGDNLRLINELVQTAAVCQAIFEDFAREPTEVEEKAMGG